MRKMIKYLIIVLCILIICILLLLFKFKFIDKRDSKDTYTKEEASQFDVKVDDNIVIDTYENEIMSVKNCVQKYIDYIDDENYEAVLNILDDEYKQESQISINNVNSKVEKATGNYICKQIKKKEISIDSSIFYVYGKLISENKTINNDLNYTVIVDYTNNSYSITKGIDEEKNNESIIQNEYNEFEFKEYSEEDIIRELFYNYKYLMLDDVENAFNLLEEKYKSKRFDNDLNEFREYINEQTTKIENSTFIQYAEIEDNKYVVQDDLGNQYIFDIKDFYNYTVKLDIYTVLDEYFIQQYNEANKESKAHTNVDIFLQMINSKDYKQAYEKVGDKIKENNLNSIDKFKEYMSDNFYSTNYLEVNDIEQNDDGNYIVNVTLKDNVSSVANSMKKSLIIQLMEDNDFRIIF